MGKRKIYLLYAAERDESIEEMDIYISRVNDFLNDKCAEIIVVYAQDLAGYNEGRISMDFNNFEVVFFLVKSSWQIGQTEILRQYIEYYQRMDAEQNDIAHSGNTVHKCFGYLFQSNCSRTVNGKNNVNITDDLLQNSGYIVPCVTKDSMFLGILLIIEQICRRHRCHADLYLHDDAIFLADKLILPVRNIPEIKMNRNLLEIQKKIVLMEEKRKNCTEQERELCKLINKKREIEEHLFTTLSVFYDVTKQWDVVGRTIAGYLYEQVFSEEERKAVKIFHGRA